MKVIDGRPGARDPLASAGGVLLAVVLAFILSVLVSALIASQFSASYQVRAFAYLGLVLWVLCGSALLFRATLARGEPGPFRVRRVAVWMISIWVWPLLLLGRRRGSPP